MTRPRRETDAEMGSYEGPLRCPRCGYVGHADEFDCLGADAEMVFCPRCGREVRCEMAWQFFEVQG